MRKFMHNRAHSKQHSKQYMNISLVVMQHGTHDAQKKERKNQNDAWTTRQKIRKPLKKHTRDWNNKTQKYRLRKIKCVNQVTSIVICCYLGAPTSRAGGEG